MVIGNSRAADKNCSVPLECEGDLVTLTYVRSLNCAHPPHLQAITP